MSLRSTTLAVRLAAATAAGVLLAGPHAGSAQTGGGIERFTGSYRYRGSMEEQRAVRERAVDLAIDGLGELRRLRSRRQLLRSAPPIETATVSFASGWVEVRYDGGRVFRSPLGSGTGAGELHRIEVRVSHRYEAGRLVQTLDSRRATTVLTFSLSPDGRRLTCAIQVERSGVPRPVRYTLILERATGAP
jgi:hypothetical protein